MLHRFQLFRRFSSAVKNELKASVFTGKADFYETLYFLDDVVIQLRGLNSTNQYSIEYNWLNREKLQNKLGFDMSLLEYRQIRQRLSKIQQAASISPNIFEFLKVFGEPVRTVDSELLSEAHSKLELKKESSLGKIDELGRAVAVGRRKSSTSKVMVLPGNGEFRVNGKPLVDYFMKPRDIYAIAKPFQITESFGKFNVWALVKGGGTTGMFNNSQFLNLFLFRSIRSHNSRTC